MNPKHECVFCMCNQCNLKIVNNSRKGKHSTRSRCNQMISVDDKYKEKNQGDIPRECNA